MHDDQPEDELEFEEVDCRVNEKVANRAYAKHPAGKTGTKLGTPTWAVMMRLDSPLPLGLEITFVWNAFMERQVAHIGRQCDRSGASWGHSFDSVLLSESSPLRPGGQQPYNGAPCLGMGAAGPAVLLLLASSTLAPIYTFFFGRYDHKLSNH